VPEKRSRYEFTFMAEPMVTGTFTRRQAPEGEVSSSLAEEVWRVPNWSSQETSTTAIMAVRGSVLVALILSLCIGRNWERFRGVGDRRCDAVGVHGWKCCRVERRTGRSACATWTGAKHLWLEVLCYRGASRNACATGFPGIGVGRKITMAGGRAEGGFT
jgi:hypothetical protein